MKINAERCDKRQQKEINRIGAVAKKRRSK
jgi:hypothetical protein